MQCLAFKNCIRSFEVKIFCILQFSLFSFTPVQNRFKKLVAKVLRCDHGDSVKQNNRDSHIGGQDHGTHSKYV